MGGGGAVVGRLLRVLLSNSHSNKNKNKRVNFMLIIQFYSTQSL